VAASASALERLTPDRRLYLDGKAVDPALAARISRVVVELADDSFNLCTLTLNDPDMSLVSGDTLTAGMGLGIELGYQGRLKLVFDGEIVALEPRFARDKPPALVVRALERLHRLALAPRTRSFHDADVKAIATKVAHEHGLSAEAPSGMKGHLLQPNVSDFALLRKIAARNGHHVYQSGKKLVIGPPPSLGEIELRPGAGLRSLKLKLRATEQVPKVIVRGWDPKTKKEIIGQSTPSGEAADGAAAAKPFGRTDFFIEGVHVIDTADADAIAKAAVARIAERYAVAAGELIGDPEVVPGKVLSFDKLGELLDGKYRVTSARHEFDRRGYGVKFEATRVARKKAAVKFKAPTSKAAELRAAAAEKQKKKELAEEKCTIDVVLKDGAGNAVSGVKAIVEIVGQEKQEPSTDGSGGIKITELPKGVGYSITFVPAEAAAEFKVVDGDGKALKGVKARFFPPKGEPQDPSGTDGAFKVEGRTEGEEYSVLLTGDSTAEFGVQDSAGTPVKGLAAVIEFPGGRSAKVKADDSGNFKLPDLLEGEEYAVSLTGELTGDATAEFTVEDWQGKPRTNLTATFAFESGKTVTVKPDGAGVFKVPNVFQGESYTVELAETPASKKG
jgi:phage protein D